MPPVRFEIAGVSVINSYGVSKAPAALLAAWLSRHVDRVGSDPARAWTLATPGLVPGFAGGKLCHLAETVRSLLLHDLGRSGFTWYGGLLAGIGCFLSSGASDGKPLYLPWPVAFPDGTTPTLVPVHPMALHQALALVRAGALWALRGHHAPMVLVAVGRRRGAPASVETDALVLAGGRG